MTPRVDICICTYNPRPDIFRRVIDALARQSARTAMQVIVIDNASSPPLREADLAPLAAAGVVTRLCRELERGVAFARGRAIRESTAPLILFVDDDNELADDYVEVALALADAHPEVGCLGGQLLPAPGVVIPRWFRPIASFFAIDPDGFSEARTGYVTYKATPNDPPTAGLLVRRAIVELYLEFAPMFGELGRTPGRAASVEDSLLVRQAHRLGFLCARRPELRLWHHIDPRRFELRNALAFFHSHGGVQITLGRLVGHGDDRYHRELMGAARAVALSLVGRCDPRTAACLAAWELGRRTALWRADLQKRTDPNVARIGAWSDR